MDTYTNNSRAVTLVEMLVVIAIIATLASMVLTVVLRVQRQSEENTLKETFSILETALHEYYEYKGSFPLQTQLDPNFAPRHIELLYTQLDSVPPSREVLKRVRDSLVVDRMIVTTLPAPAPEIYDPWGTALDYICLPDYTFPLLVSAGKDKDFRTVADNITNKDK